MLKRRSFTPMPMPDLVIQRVNTIGEREKQGRTFQFLNQRGEPYEWTDKVPEDGPEFQGLLDENEGTAVYPDVSAELPGVELEVEECDYQTIADEPETDFRDLAGAALHTAGIDANAMIWNTRGGDIPPAGGPALIKANGDKIVYKLMFDLPDAGFGVPGADDTLAIGNDRRDDASTVVMAADEDTVGQGYPTRTHRSAVGNQPYNTYAPQTTYLQLGMVRAHRSVLEANRLARMTTEERLLATTTTASKPFIDDVTH